MMLMICATGALRLGRFVCRALALDGIFWVSWKFERGHKAVETALTGFGATVS